MHTKHLATLIAPAMLCRPAVLPAAGGAGQGPAAFTAAEQLRQAMLAPSSAVLQALVADDLSYGHSSGRVDTKATFIADLLSGASHFTAITITDETVAITGPNAIVRHTLSATTNDGGKPGSITLKVLQVWQQQQQQQPLQQQAGPWRLLARQAVRAG